MSTHRSPLRVLVPYRLDFFARAMDTTLPGMWLALQHACDAVFWGPGLPGFDPERSIDEIATDVAADVVLLPDLHHATPGLWTELLRDAERITCPTVLFMSDPGSAIEQRREQLRTLRPTAVLGLGPAAAYSHYEEQLDTLGAQLLVRPLGHDPALFWSDGVEQRDIDVLVCGAAGSDAYRVRTRIQQAARSLSTHRNIYTLEHPGYWECGVFAPARRGQPAFAELLRRSRMVVTGTTWQIMSAKYYEAAACGAIGVGDLPDQPGSSDLRDAMLVVRDDELPAEIASRIDSLLDDEAALGAMRDRGLAAAHRTTIHDRAQLTVDLLTSVADAPRASTERARIAIERLPDPVCIVVQTDPSAPRARRDWIAAHAVEDVRRALETSTATTCVIAFDPDAATQADAIQLAAAARRAGGAAMRPATAHGHTVATLGFVSFAAPREHVLAALDHIRAIATDEDGDAVVQAAAWLVITSCALHALEHPGYDPPVARAARIRGHELAQRASSARFAVLDPNDPALIQRIIDLAREGSTAPPVELGVPARIGIDVPTATEALVRCLVGAGIDLDTCTDLVVIERPLLDDEIELRRTAMQGHHPHSRTC